MVSAPSYARCMIKRYRHCYNLEHTCPSFCHNGCTVECVSCMPISYKTPPPPDSDHPPSQTPPIYVTPPSTPSYSPSSHSPPTTSPSSPPWSTPPTPPTTTPTSPSPPSQSTPSPTPPTTTPSSPLPTPPTTTPSSSPSPPSSSTPSPTPPTTTPSLPSPPSQSTPSPTPPTTTPSMFGSTLKQSKRYKPHSILAKKNLKFSEKQVQPQCQTGTPPSPSPQSLSTPPNTTASPSTPTPTPPTTPSNPTPSTHTPTPHYQKVTQHSSPPPSTPSTSPKTARCKNKYYPRCYNTEHVCPSACPGGCEIDCATCKPSVIDQEQCAKKDHDFCLVSDPNLHINAHFIGKRNENLTRDFTWVQSISIFFDKHQLFLGALKASTWDDSADRLSLAFDGEPLNFPGNEGSKWQSTSVPSVSITRISDSNNVVVEVEGLLKITAKVVPITEEDSRIHNYGITSTSTFQRR
ncbi:hypothetical protein NC652_023574 [Populus alba x Populus x berolinensis]|nr:hypothetical protein NC652_023574 [Populus alba x Populus x berolinensis]